MVLSAVASDDEWRAFERLIDSNLLQASIGAKHELQLAEKSGDKQGELNAIRKLTYSRGTEHFGPAMPAQVDHGIALARELGDVESLAWLLAVKSALEAEAGRSAEAEAWSQQAIAIAENNNLTRIHGYTLIWKARSIDESRKSNRLAAMTKAYKLFEAARDNRGMAYALSMMASVYLFDEGGTEAREEAMKKVIEYGTRALALIDPDVYRNTAAETHNYIAAAYIQIDDLGRARAHAQKALDIAGSYHNSMQVVQMKIKLANISKLEGRLEEALAHLDSALRIAQQSEASVNYQLFAALYRRGELLAHLGRKQESLEALSQAQARLPVIEQAGALRMVLAYYFDAARAYRLLGDYRQAYIHMLELSDRQRGAAAATNQKATAEFAVRFDAQIKETENALLRSQQRQAKTKRVALTLALALSLALLGTVWFYLGRRAAAARLEAAHHGKLAAAEAAANDAKRTFLANMSHELRTPLNVVLGFSQLLMRRAELPEDVRKDLAIVYNNGHHLYTLINQVLDLSKIDAGRLTLSEANFDLYALLDELTEMFTLVANQKGLHLIIENDPQVPQYLHADGLKLRQALINLLNNAIKFTDTGSVALNVAPAASEENMLTFVVSDTGPGIGQDELGKLGSAFVQAQAGRTAKEGTGLGLAISSSFVRLMGGSELKFSSQPGSGTTVAFDLPVQVVDAVAQTTDCADRVVTGLASGQPRYRILVADDWPEGRQLLNRLLTPLGFEVREAENGEAALAIWDEWSPHLIWMDMHMPVMDGREATRRIKSAQKSRSTVIIALTASSFDEDRQQILADGCDDLLRKPFRDADLFDMMRKHLDMEFIYEGTEEANTEPVSIAGIPTELRARLRQALEELDADAVEAVIEQIRDYDETLANTLEQMAYRYEYDRMRELVAQQATAFG